MENENLPLVFSVRVWGDSPHGSHLEFSELFGTDQSGLEKGPSTRAHDAKVSHYFKKLDRVGNSVISIRS